MTIGCYEGKRWRQSRRAAFARDNRRCQGCGRRDDLHAHHIEPVREFAKEEDAHFADNLVILCKYCHREWEGRRERPRLADAGSETTVNEVVNDCTLTTVRRHALSGAMQEIVLRWIVSNPGICSNCLSPTHGQKVRNKYKKRFFETLRAVIRRESELPSPSRELYRRDVVESYCPGCRPTVINTHRDFENRLYALSATLSAHGFPQLPKEELYEYQLTNHYHTHGGDGEHRLAEIICDLYDLPPVEPVSVMYDFAVPDRYIKEKGGRVKKEDPTEDYLEWHFYERGKAGYDTYRGVDRVITDGLDLDEPRQ